MHAQLQRRKTLTTSVVHILAAFVGKMLRAKAIPRFLGK